MTSCECCEANVVARGFVSLLLVCYVQPVVHKAQISSDGDVAEVTNPRATSSCSSARFRVIPHDTEPQLRTSGGNTACFSIMKQPTPLHLLEGKNVSATADTPPLIPIPPPHFRPPLRTVLRRLLLKPPSHTPFTYSKNPFPSTSPATALVSFYNEAPSFPTPRSQRNPAVDKPPSSAASTPPPEQTPMQHELNTKRDRNIR